MPKVSKIKAASSRPGNVTAPKDPLTQFICTRCGKIYKRQKENFSPSFSPLYRGNNGYLTVCKSCMDDLLDHYKEVFENEAEAIRRLCLKFDIYWNPKIYGMIYKGATTHSRIRGYISRCNLNCYVGKTYDDTLDEEAAVAEAESDVAEAELEKKRIAEEARLAEEEERRAQEIEERIQTEAQALAEKMVAEALTVRLNMDGEVENGTEPTEELPMPDAEVIRFWGNGFTADYYYALQDRYESWTADIPQPMSAGMVSLYKQVCICEESINRGIIAGQPVDKMQGTLNTLLGSLNEKPTQKKQDEALDAEFEQMSFGQGIRMCENIRPIPKPDPMFQDVDGIKRYIQIWFVGHLSKMLNLRNSYSKMYENEIARLRVERPDMINEDDEALFSDIFGDDGS